MSERTGRAGLRGLARSGRWRTPGAALVAVVLLLLVGLGVAAETAPAAPGTPASHARTARFVPVARAAAVCPDVVADKATSTKVVLAAPGPIDNRTPRRRATASGLATLRPLGADGPDHARLTSLGAVAYDAAPGPAAVVTSDTAADGEPDVARAGAGLAPGFVAGMTTRSTSEDIRGLASTPCAAPDTDFWFVGSGAVVGRRGRLYLSNPESVPAVVDVMLYGPDGPVDAPSGRGVTVAAGAQQVLKLDALAPDVPEFGVHVSVAQGRVSAALRDQEVQGLTPKGADWVPAAQPPSRRLVLPDVLGGAGERRLQVVVPGDSDAIVRVRLIGADGSFVPSGLDVVEARAHRVSDVDLAPFTGQQAVGVELTSDQPVTAGVLQRVGGTGNALAELAYTAAAPAITAAAPGVLTDLRGKGAGTGVGAKLVLVAPDGPATVRLTVLPPSSGTARTVTVPAASQVVLDATTLSDAASYSVALVPTSRSGRVMVAREVTEAQASGPMVTVTVLRPGRYAVAVPRVLADLSTGLRPRRSTGQSSP